MNDEKNRKILRLKTFEEMRNDSVYEINLFSRKRRGQGKLSRIFDEDQIEEQVSDEKFFSIHLYFIHLGYHRFG